MRSLLEAARREFAALAARTYIPLAELVHSARRPSRRDCAAVGVSVIDAEFDLPHNRESVLRVCDPRVHRNDVVPQPKTVFSECRLRLAQTDCTMVRLSAGPVKRASRASAKLALKISAQVETNACRTRVAVHVRATHDVSVVQAFGEVRVRACAASLNESPLSTGALEVALSHAASENALIGAVQSSEPGREITRRRQRALTEGYFDHERRLIAAQAGIDVSRVRWIGLFRNVPLAAAQALRVDETAGMLILSLRPDASVKLANKARATVTIAMGRDTQTGSILQVVV